MGTREAGCDAYFNQRLAVCFKVVTTDVDGARHLGMLDAHPIGSGTQGGQISEGTSYISRGELCEFHVTHISASVCSITIAIIRHHVGAQAGRVLALTRPSLCRSCGDPRAASCFTARISSRLERGCSGRVWLGVHPCMSCGRTCRLRAEEEGRREGR